MGQCEIKNPPVFTYDIEKWDQDTFADGPAMSAEIEKLLNNTAHNKKESERLAGKELKNIKIPIEDWKDLSYTIDDAAITAESDVVVCYAFDSIPSAQKANIRGRLEPGKLILVAKKLPNMELIIESIKIVNPK